MTKTEKLRERIIETYELVSRQANLAGLHPQEFKEKLSDQILKACKESGLMFTQTGVRGDDLEGAYLCKVEEIEI